ncbi:MAG: amino acid permease [Coriobacteriia bacterium]|nr:amino acid permease [Coriobacteriia bacterium]MCL2536699.1 amino acid permease [Coriobacteriia bacterium]
MARSVQAAAAKKSLTMLGFYGLTVAMTMDLHIYPAFAQSGLSLVFFLLVGGILWFIPTALVSAEMATVESWESGGIYVWVKNTLGERYGFAAVFFQWLQVTVGFIAMLYFILGAVASVTGWAALNNDPVVKALAAIGLFWVVTILQFRGTKVAERMGDIGGVVGIIVPTIVLTVLALLFLATGGQSATPLTTSALLPDFTKITTLVVFVSFMLSYMGVESSASYANDLQNPGRNYPIAMFLMVITAIALNTIGGMSVALTIPTEKISLNTGIIDALSALFAHAGVHASWAANVIALMIAVGVSSQVASWVVGPARGIYMAAQQGLLPPIFRKVNQHDIPIVLIVAQGIIVSLWAVVLTLGGGGNNLSFLIAIALTVCIYVVAYVLMFAGYFKLVFKQRDLPRKYQIPGGVFGKTIVAGIGLFTTLCAFAISFVPPAGLQAGQSSTYLIILAACFVLAFITPFWIYARHDKSKHKTIVLPSLIRSHELGQHRFSLPRFRAKYHLRPAPEDYLPFSWNRKVRREQHEDMMAAYEARQQQSVEPAAYDGPETVVEAEDIEYVETP